jgi:hypothetical protein
MTMEGFKQFKKVPCFKEGGSVQRQIANFEKRERKVEKNDDVAKDKKIVKKAFKIHDTQQHEEKTNLKGLKRGGRAKKEVGTVKKYACGGGVYGAKKTKEDIKSIDDAKNCKPKKLQAGGMSGPAPAGQPAAAPSAPMGQMTELEKRRNLEKMARAKKYLSPSQQSELIKQDPRAAGLTGNIGYKKGGKVKKYGIGGAIAKASKSQLMPAALFGPPAAVAVHSDMKSQEKKAAEEAGKNKEADAKSAPAKKRGGKIC